MASDYANMALVLVDMGKYQEALEKGNKAQRERRDPNK
jgi:hypothetical protein